MKIKIYIEGNTLGKKSSISLFHLDAVSYNKIAFNKKQPTLSIYLFAEGSGLL